jgi:hypothetical protein
MILASSDMLLNIYSLPVTTALVAAAGAISATSFLSGQKAEPLKSSRVDTGSSAESLSSPTKEAHECDCMPLWCVCVVGE